MLVRICVVARLQGSNQVAYSGEGRCPRKDDACAKVGASISDKYTLAHRPHPQATRNSKRGASTC